MFHVPNCYRLREGLMGSDDSYGNNGAFRLPDANGDRTLWIIASDGGSWEHVSVHANDGKRNCTPIWDEMCRVKDLFWDGEDVVMQLHPRRSQYVNDHPYTLHLWKPIAEIIPEPPAIMVGVLRKQQSGNAADLAAHEARKDTDGV